MSEHTDHHHHHGKAAPCCHGGHQDAKSLAQPGGFAPDVSKKGGVIYTCPMHPEVRRDAPGSCPICGMALEPLMAAGEEPENVELHDMTWRFWISTALTLPLLWALVGEAIPALDPMLLLGHRTV